MRKQAEQLLLTSEPRKQQAMKMPKEQVGYQKRRAISWLSTLVIFALLVVAALGLLRSFIAIITLD